VQNRLARLTAIARRTPALLAALGVCVVLAGCIETDQSIRVAHLKFTGVKSVNKGQLRSVLATVQSSKLPWGETHYFNRQQFDADLKRVVAFYSDRGYPDAKVKSFDVELNQKKDAVDITIDIDEGQPLLVERIEYSGLEVIPRRHFFQMRRQLPLRAGVPLDRALAQTTRETVLDEIKDHGYPYASVRLTDRPGSSDHQRILSIDVTPGTLARYGQIEIVGNSSVSDDVVLRQLTYKTGWRYRLSQVQESQRRLYGLETFQFVNVESNVKEGEQPDIVPTKITVTEGKHRKVNFGFGYGSEEHLRGNIDWRHVNFFGGARTMQFIGQYSSLDRGVRANFKQPALFGPRYSMIVSGQLWHNDEPAFKLDTDGGSITIVRPLARRGPYSQREATTTLSLKYTNEYERYTVSEEAQNDPTFRDDLIALGLDPETGEGRGTLSALAFDVSRSTVESQLSARNGYTISAHAERAGSFINGDFKYWETILEGRVYVALSRKALVAARLRGGAIDGLGDQDLNVPFFKRYFLGGASSLRGWGRFEVSPLSGAGEPVGGATQLEGSAELRIPLGRNFSAVGFVDAGNVWADPWAFKLKDLRYDVGPGLRYNTPVGPLRLDVGYQLNPIPGLVVNGDSTPPRFRIHFSIGQAF
jgi:outer membrane protein insertion porin family/translocation and assembly module TamA